MDALLPETNPVYGPFFGVMGAASAIIFTCEFTSDEWKVVSQLIIESCD